MEDLLPRRFFVLLNNLSRLPKMYGLKYIYVLFEFKHTVFFTSHGGYLLNTSLCVLRGGGSVNRLLTKFLSDRTGTKSPLRRLKNIGMVSETLYRNTLKILIQKSCSACCFLVRSRSMKIRCTSQINQQINQRFFCLGTVNNERAV